MNELKIMSHLGHHLNIVNLLGAVTVGIADGEERDGVAATGEFFGEVRHDAFHPAVQAQWDALV